MGASPGSKIEICIEPTCIFLDLYVYVFLVEIVFFGGNGRNVWLKIANWQRILKPVYTKRKKGLLAVNTLQDGEVVQPGKPRAERVKNFTETIPWGKK